MFKMSQALFIVITTILLISRIYTLNTNEGYGTARIVFFISVNKKLLADKHEFFPQTSIVFHNCYNEPHSLSVLLLYHSEIPQQMTCLHLFLIFTFIW